mgnify:CR=1 FL=1
MAVAVAVAVAGDAARRGGVEDAFQGVGAAASGCAGVFGAVGFGSGCTEGVDQCVEFFSDDGVEVSADPFDDDAPGTRNDDDTALEWARRDSIAMLPSASRTMPGPPPLALTYAASAKVCCSE